MFDSVLGISFGEFSFLFNILFYVFGIVGLLLITYGVLSKFPLIEKKYFIFGGIFMTIYSLFMGDLIFILLQIVFLSASIYKFFKIKKQELIP